MKKTIFPALIGLLCLISCEKREAPILGDIVIDELTFTSITCHIDVTGGDATSCVFYYGTTRKSVLNETSSKVNGICEGTVVQGEITGLTSNKVYYIKAVGMNDAGSSETEVVKFQTPPRTPAADDNKHPTLP